MNTIEDKVEHLSRLLSEKRAGYLAEVEACLAEIMELNSPTEIDELLPILDDAGDDEAMFMIVHAVERWGDRAYCQSLLAAIERLWKSSPRWTQILHIRVMNSLCTSDEYVRLVESLSASSKQVVRDVFSSIQRNWPKLSGKVDAILARI